MYCQPNLKSLVYKWLNINHHCLLCDEPAEQAYPLCVPCEQELPWLQEHCIQCALPLPITGMACADCSRRPPPFEQVVAPFHYGFPVDTLISRFKHRSQWPMGRLLALLLAQALQHRYAEGQARPDVLLPVPLARRRLRQRGFNQAGMLARWLAKPLKVPVDEQVLIRQRDTPAQQTLDAKARRRNLRHAFALLPDVALEGRHVAIVDDVLTTGATVRTLAGLLRKAGARRVDVYCLARTPRPQQG